MSKIVIPIVGKTTTVPVAECPDCLARLDRATGEESWKPGPGHFSICVECGAILRFDEQMNLYRASEQDLEELPPEEREKALEMSKAFKAAGRFMAQGKGRGAFIGVKKDQKPT